ncbi:MAG: S8 family peptidase [Actinomycetota bacterium]
MRMKGLASAGLALCSFLAFAPSRAASYEPVIGIIDTGVRSTHQEFSLAQFVAWWDFSSDRGPAENPAPGVVWDFRGGRHPSAPFDEYGHGTAVASMATGLNANGRTSPSLAPGFKLAVAKVANADGTFTGDINAAIYWLVDTVHVDVINMSFTSSVLGALPAPSVWFHSFDAAVQYAHSKGITITVANGNGVADTGLAPMPGDMTDPADLPQVISVGASGTDGFTNNTDPMVTAAYSPEVASIYDDQGNPCDSCYSRESGTSFSSPFVAGFAAQLIKASHDAGQSADPDYIKQLIEYSAQSNALYPPSTEGYGQITAPILIAALSHARSHTLPTPDPTRKLYVDTVAGSLRTIFGS